MAAERFNPNEPFEQPKTATVHLLGRWLAERPRYEVLRALWIFQTAPLALETRIYVHGISDGEHVAVQFPQCSSLPASPRKRLAIGTNGMD